MYPVPRWEKLHITPYAPPFTLTSFHRYSYERMVFSTRKDPWEAIPLSLKFPHLATYHTFPAVVIPSFFGMGFISYAGVGAPSFEPLLSVSPAAFHLLTRLTFGAISLSAFNPSVNTGAAFSNTLYPSSVEMIFIMSLSFVKMTPRSHSRTFTKFSLYLSKLSSTSQRKSKYPRPLSSSAQRPLSLK